jgi:hypothetical protein
MRVEERLDERGSLTTTISYGTPDRAPGAIKEHLGSIRELLDKQGALLAQLRDHLSMALRPDCPEENPKKLSDVSSRSPLGDELVELAGMVSDRNDVISQLMQRLDLP